MYWIEHEFIEILVEDEFSFLLNLYKIDRFSHKTNVFNISGLYSFNNNYLQTMKLPLFHLQQPISVNYLQSYS